MSAKKLYAPSGGYHTPVLDQIAALPRSDRSSADAAWKALCGFLRPGSTELRITDQMLSRSIWLEGYSLRYLRKGLAALEGLGLIERERRRGLRRIVVTGRLKCRDHVEADKKLLIQNAEQPAARHIRIPVEVVKPVPQEDIELARALFPRRMAELAPIGTSEQMQRHG